MIDLHVGRLVSERQRGIAMSAGLLLVLFAALYMFFPLMNHTEGEDAIYFASNVRNGIPEAHPNHLLFEPLHYTLHRAAEAFAGKVSCFSVLSAVSSCSPLMSPHMRLRWEVLTSRKAISIGHPVALAMDFGISRRSQPP